MYTSDVVADTHRRGLAPVSCRYGDQYGLAKSVMGTLKQYISRSAALGTACKANQVKVSSHLPSPAAQPNHPHHHVPGSFDTAMELTIFSKPAAAAAATVTLADGMFTCRSRIHVLCGARRAERDLRHAAVHLRARHREGAARADGFSPEDAGDNAVRWPGAGDTAAAAVLPRPGWLGRPGSFSWRRVECSDVRQKALDPFPADRRQVQQSPSLGMGGR